MAGTDLADWLVVQNYSQAIFITAGQALAVKFDLIVFGYPFAEASYFTINGHTTSFDGTFHFPA